MPRPPRTRSEMDIYHVMIRGMDRLQLFYDDADKKAFLSRLSLYREECDLAVYSWCLMGNHVHLLLKADMVALSDAMKRLQLSYAHYYNAKYDRIGYLFQDRFKSKPIEDEAYFFQVLRYIILNPAESGDSYREWTSFNETVGGRGLVDSDFVISHFGESRPEALKAFIGFIEGALLLPREERMKPDQGRRRIKDSEAIVMIREETGSADCAALCDMEKGERNVIVGRLRENGLTIRQISRLTGLSRGIVERATRRTS